MSKKARHTQDLDGLFDQWVQDGRPQGLTGYLLSNSNLPGRRANLELAAAFGDVAEVHARAATGELWGLCLTLTEISADQAPVNTAEEFLPFCGTIGLGAIGSASPEFYDRALRRLRTLASDPRWRMREAVCFALQRLLARRSSDTLKVLEDWAKDRNLLEMRAAAAAVADPGLLEDGAFAARALQIHEIVFEQFPQIDDRRAEAFRILRKGLGYTLSVVVCATPEEGFGVVERLIASNDGDQLWIVRENLKKKRLVASYPHQVEAIQKRIG